MNKPRLFCCQPLLLFFVFIIPTFLCAQEKPDLKDKIEHFVKQMEVGKDSTQFNLYFMINELDNLALDAYQSRIRPTSMGGGGGVYTNYVLSNFQLLSGTYSYAKSPEAIFFVGTSRYGYGNVQLKVDSTGALNFLDVSGMFRDKLKSK